MQHPLKLERIINKDAFAARIGKLTAGGYDAARRPAIVEAFKNALADGKAEAEAMLMKDGSGMACAMRLPGLGDR